MSSIYMVFWLDQDGKPQCQEHQDLNGMLNSTKALRDGGMARFVCSATEDSNMVGKFGVGELPTDYNWFKRRPDPQIPLGRKRNANDNHD